MLGGSSPLDTPAHDDTEDSKDSADKKESEKRLKCGGTGERIFTRPDRDFAGKNVLRETYDGSTEADSGDQKHPQRLRTQALSARRV